MGGGSQPSPPQSNFDWGPLGKGVQQGIGQYASGVASGAQIPQSQISSFQTPSFYNPPGQQQGDIISQQSGTDILSLLQRLGIF
jgi:hypothetical protein